MFLLKTWARVEPQKPRAQISPRQPAARKFFWFTASNLNLSSVTVKQIIPAAICQVKIGLRFYPEWVLNQPAGEGAGYASGRGRGVETENCPALSGGLTARQHTTRHRLCPKRLGSVALCRRV